MKQTWWKEQNEELKSFWKEEIEKFKRELEMVFFLIIFIIIVVALISLLNRISNGG